MRKIARHTQPVRVAPCAAVAGQTGGVVSVELYGRDYVMTAAVRPDRQSERRERGTLRPRERRLLLPERDADIRQGDHCYFEGDLRCWRVMQLRQYPLHREIEVEVEG